MWRILHVVRTVSGGMRGHVGAILQHLEQDEFEFGVACPPQAGLLAYFCAAGARVFPVNLGYEHKAWRDWQAAGELNRLVRSEGFDLIHAHGTRAGVLGALASRYTGVPLLVTHHNFRYAPLKPLLRPLFAAAFRHLINANAHHFIAVSRALAAELLAHEGLNNKRVHVIGNGIEWQKFELPPPFAKSEPCVGMLTRLIALKGVGYFIKSAALIHRLQPGVRFLIVGEGPERRALEAMARKLNLTPVMEFSGWVPDIKSALADMDIVVIPSLYEGFGITALEAMAAARPVVAFASGGLAEVVVSGETGLLVGRGDYSGLAASILELLNQPERARAMGLAGRRRVAEHFNLENMLRETVRVYRLCLEDREGGGCSSKEI